MADRKLKIDIRRNQILQMLRKEGRITVAQLSKVLGATEVTIRNDLTELEQEGLLLRVQGGAILTQGQKTAAPGSAQIQRLAQKQAIAKGIADRIRDGDILFINSGTTTACVAEALRVRKNLKIVTNSIAVATALGDIATLRVTLLGGDINAQYGFTYGSTAQEQLSQYQANWAILSVDGVSAAGGITTYHAEEAILDRMMMGGAERTLIAADSTKLGRTGFSRICDCAPGLTLVTDTCQSKETAQQLEDSGVQILFVE